MTTSLKDLMEERLKEVSKLKSLIPDDGYPGNNYKLFSKYESEEDAIKTYLKITPF